VDQAAARKEFRGRAKTITNRWQLRFPDDETSTARMPWNTYQAVVKRNGGPYATAKYPNIEYDWITKL
jgi:hypothetical protein